MPYRRRMKNRINKFKIFILLAGIALGCGSCGIEDYIYLYPVQDGNINVRLTENAAIRLPAADFADSQYFTHFAIFYRIYVSDILIPAVNNTTEMQTINAALYSDYNSIYPSTSSNSSSTSVNTSVGSLFSTRRYYELELEGAAIESILDYGVLGSELSIDFPNQINVRPTLSINGGAPYTLWRSTGNNAFNPAPDRYFVNSDELNRTENAVATVNGDVVDKAGISGRRYAYVSMYIVKIGRDSSTLATIYSSPTFIGVLKLPDDT
jgi:hypothetical protein